MRNILVIGYSQTGQLKQITDAIISPLKNSATVTVDYHQVTPKKAFSFPWSFFDFFQVMPESVYMKPIELSSQAPIDKKYDLIILSYQVWFLSPSLPISSFLQTEDAKILFKNTPTITVLGCRGMWLTAQEKMKGLLANVNAKLIDNIVLTDECGAGFSFLATPLWMFTGKKKSLSWVPKAGVSEQDINAAERFGLVIKEKFSNPSNENVDLSQSMMTGLDAVKINEKFIFSEKIGHRSFKVWGKLLMLLGPQDTLRRKIGLCFYTIFLVILIVTVVPITALIIKLLSSIFKNKIAKQKQYYAQPSGE
ncbi:dialkylresorcinol condensing enzyme [Pseudocolwellia sp. HL-MZ19]|uniref:dialkylrecorsinol condensing enzyme n=1 Tax=Pseudocolwellia sp. HL-MZ19 TaxID=3400846 RepID=UPI003CEAB405